MNGVNTPLGVARFLSLNPQSQFSSAIFAFELEQFVGCRYILGSRAMDPTTPTPIPTGAASLAANSIHPSIQ